MRQLADAAARRTIEEDSTEPVESWTEWFAAVASAEGEAFAWALEVSCFFMSVDKGAAKSVAASGHTVRKTACWPNNLAESPTGVSFFQMLVADSCNLAWGDKCLCSRRRTLRSLPRSVGEWPYDLSSS